MRYHAGGSSSNNNTRQWKEQPPTANVTHRLSLCLGLRKSLVFEHLRAVPVGSWWVRREIGAALDEHGAGGVAGQQGAYLKAKAAHRERETGMGGGERGAHL